MGKLQGDFDGLNSREIDQVNGLIQAALEKAALAEPIVSEGDSAEDAGLERDTENMDPEEKTDED